MKFSPWQPKHLLFLAVLTYLIVFFGLCFYKYSHFLYNLEDLSIFNNVLYNTAHGKIFWFSSHGGFSYLSDHLELGLLLILPFYFFWQSPLLLLFLQTALFAFSAWPLYLIAKKSTAKTSVRLPFFVALIYLLSPFVHNINLEEFHIAPLLIFSFLWTFYFYLQKKYRLFLLLFIFTLLIREDAALTLGALAVVIAWDIYRKDKTRRFFHLWCEKKWWLYPLLLSVFWFFTALKLICWFNPDGNFKFFLLYQNLNLSSPLAWWPHFFNLNNFWIAVGFLTPFLFLPLYRPKYLFLALPTFLQISLLDTGSTSIIYFTHYQIFILTAILLSFSDSLAALLNFKKIRRFAPLLIILLLVSQIYVSLFFGPLNSLLKKEKHNLANLENEKENNKIISLIPPSASLSGPYRLNPRLSSREKCYFNKLIFLGKKHLAIEDFTLPPNTEYLLIDSVDMIEYYLHFQNRARYSNLYWEGAERMRETIANRNYQPLVLTDSLMLLKKDAPARSLPFETVNQIPAGLFGQKNDFGEIEFLGFARAGHQTKEQNLALDLFFKTRQKIYDDYLLEFSVYDPQRKLLWQKVYPPAFGLLPTHEWPDDGQYIKITQILPADLPAGILKMALMKIKGDIELGALNDVQLIIDKKDKLGETMIDL